MYFLRDALISTENSQHLNDLFLSDRWKAHFRTLSNASGFNLSIYSEQGELIFSTEDYIPMCRGLLSSPEFKSKCDTYCRVTMMSSIEENKPVIFKCYAKTMSFSIPVEYFGEKAVIVGQGSFSTYEDFLEFEKLLALSKVKDFPVTGPLKFTTSKQAENACHFVSSSVNQPLRSSQETIILKQKMDRLLKNQKLHFEMHAKIAKFTAISEFTSEMASILGWENLLQMILNKSTELLKAEQGSLMILNKETDVLLLEARKGIAEGITEKLKIQKGEGIAGRVAELGGPFLVGDIESDPRTNQKNRLRYKTKSFISVPIKIDDRVIGVLNIADKITGEIFNEEDLKFVQSFATQAAVVIERNMLYKQTEELRKLSITDALTGLLNRRYLQSRLEEEMLRSERHARPLSLLMLDMDGFKAYNDTFGHLMGDRALKIVADRVLNSVRSIDIVSRYGGDEFMVILPETDKVLAQSIAERLRIDMSETEMPPEGLEAPWKFTVSIGIVSYPEDGKTIDLFLENVDRALYSAKNKGRNRVEGFS